VNRMAIDIALWVLASPILFVRWLFRLFKRWQFWRMSYTARIACRNCHAVISLVGLWRCSCGYTYRGHVLEVCPVCGALPQMARCFACGVTQKLPEP
jgi:hypothetical protein